MQAFVDTRINWEGPLSAAVEIDPLTNRHVLTPEFEAVVRDVNSWKMSPQSFEIFPSLKGRMHKQKKESSEWRRASHSTFAEEIPEL